MFTRSILLASLSLYGAVGSISLKEGDLPLGTYEGYANDNTRTCWPEMSRVRLSAGPGNSHSLVAFYDIHGTYNALQLGILKEISSLTLSKFNNFGRCYYLTGEPQASKTTGRKNKVVICYKESKVVLYYRVEKTKAGVFTRLDCAVPLDPSPTPGVYAPSFNLVGQGPMKVETPPHLVGQGPMKVETPPHLVGQGPMKVDTPPHLVGQGPMKVDTPPHLFGQGPMKVDTPPHLFGQGPMKVDTPPHLFGQGPMKVDTPPHLFGQGPLKVETPPHLVGQGPATSRHPKNIVLTTGNAMGNGRVTLTVELITRYPMFNILFESLSDMSFVKLENVFAIKNPAENCIFFVGYHHHQEDIKATLATAESIIKINPLRLDNIKVCGGNPPVLYLGEETADGFGKRVAVRLVQEGDTNWGLGFDNVIV